MRTIEATLKTFVKSESTVAEKAKRGKTRRIAYDFKINKAIYLLALPGLIWYAVFCYAPIYGIIIAFKNYSAGTGILGSPWVGFKHFADFFSSIYFTRTLGNTLSINCYGLLFGFPAPVILALLLNELKVMKFKRTVQTITYLPYFISLTVICGIIVEFCSTRGIITQTFKAFGGNYPSGLLTEAKFFQPIYIISDIWQGVGWGSIIYMAALSGLNMDLYEAASIDGAGKWRQLWHITLPGITPTIVIMLILRIGSMMSLGADKIILLYNAAIYETADVIASYVYRKGLVEGNQSFATAVGLFNSLINCALVYGANSFSRKVSDAGLW
jgi:putative aldouronate transport system permease protein